MDFTLYTKADCQLCESAKRMLETRGYGYISLKIPTDITKEDVQKLVVEAGSDHVVNSVPQIFHGSKYIGGCKALSDYMKEIGPKT